MEPKQVFTAYELVDGGEQANFCLACGTALIDRPDVDGAIRRNCPSCGFVRYRNAAPGVSVLVVDGDRVVLCRRRAGAFEGGKWCLPCGYIEYDEDYLTAALREVREETGFVVEITAILSVVSNFLAPSIHTMVAVLLARQVGGQLAAGDDIEHVQWFASGDSLPEMAFEADRHIIARYFATRLAGAPVDEAYARLTNS